MATINIANLTFSHKGDYDGSTAYVKNDVVYYATNGNAYIAKQNTTGNVPTNATYWSQFAAGSGGIWNAGLSLGSAGQVVKVNSGASALEFGDAAGGNWEFITSVTPTTGAATVQFVNGTGGVTWDSTYIAFKISGYGCFANSQYAVPAFRMLQSGSEISNDVYQTSRHSFGTGYSEDKTGHTWNYFDLSRGGAYGGSGSTSKGGWIFNLIVDNVQNAHNTIMANICWEQDNNNFTYMEGGCVFKNTSNNNGISIRTNTNYGSNGITDGNWLARGKLVLCGIKA